MKPAVVPDDGIPLNSREAVPPVEQGHPHGPLYRYGGLVCFLGLIGFYIHWLFNVPTHYPYDRYGLGIISAVMLSNHLSHSFRWSRKTAFVLRLISIGWIAFAIFWLVWLGPHLFPLAR